MTQEQIITPEQIDEPVLSVVDAKGEILATCSCGKEYTIELWDELSPPPKGGTMHVPSDPACDPEDKEGRAHDLELRNCNGCGSTLSWRLDACECGLDDKHRLCSCSSTRDSLGHYYTHRDERCRVHAAPDCDND